ncbi:MAG TPA: diphosphomevalonate decarboxylase [Rectinemataceae bacterium]|nr:diphosphomevalonate decarboxylase [Rectinemataceae bacterium]
MADRSLFRVACRASPSLALVKYWGKRPEGLNLPATPSLALTLGGLESSTVVSTSPDGIDHVVVDGIEREAGRYEAFFAELRSRLGSPLRFAAESRNSFPGGAGFASSSSGFAALALACSRLVAETGGGSSASPALVSELARVGSASAARAVYGGFTLLEAGATRAEPFLPEDHWPELRIVAAVVARGEKPHSSRSAMAATRETSPYYEEWLADAPRLFERAKVALQCRDLAALGPVMRLSYSRMHASALAAEPPLLYWLPDSVALIGACASLRERGIGAWETMDAGPQVKVACLEGELPAVIEGLRAAVPGIEFLVAKAGAGPETFLLETGEPFPRHGAETASDAFCP